MQTSRFLLELFIVEALVYKILLSVPQSLGQVDIIVVRVFKSDDLLPECVYLFGTIISY